MEVVTIRPSTGGSISLSSVQRDPPFIAGGVVIGNSELAIAIGKKLAGKPPVLLNACAYVVWLTLTFFFLLTFFLLCS